MTEWEEKLSEAQAHREDLKLREHLEKLPGNSPHPNYKVALPSLKPLVVPRVIIAIRKSKPNEMFD